MQELLEAGVHFGHQVRRWNPKMGQFIFGARDGVHVIDLAHTVKKLEEACEFVKQVGANGGTIIFLGSKKQARSIVVDAATKSGAMYIAERWIGGLLTNFEQTTKNIRKLKDLRTKKESGEFSDRTKKELLLIDRDIAKLTRFYGGVENMDKLPDALFVIDVKREENACREAVKRGVPSIAICDTNADLSLITYPVPGNDDAIKAIEIVTNAIADAYRVGKEAFDKKSAQQKIALAGEQAKEKAKEELAKGKVTGGEEVSKVSLRSGSGQANESRAAEGPKGTNEQKVTEIVEEVKKVTPPVSKTNI